MGMEQEVLHLAGLGYRLFPLVPGGKVPLGSVVPHGRNDATSDQEILAEWLESNPDANWGLVTDDLLVVDIDGEGNPWPEDPEQSASLLQAGALSVTARHGKHVFFRRPPGKAWRSTASKLAEQVDTRSGGGYVVLAGSQVSGGRYEWVDGMELTRPAEDLPEPPEWLTIRLDQIAQGGRATVRTESTETGENLIGKGRRNHALASYAGTMRRVGMGLPEIKAALLEANLTRCVPPMDEAEVERIAESISRYEPDEVSRVLAEGTGLDHPFGEDGVVHEHENPGEFPRELLADLPGFLGQFVEWCQRSCYKSQPVLALGAAVTLQGLLASRKIQDPRKVRPNVYCLGTAPSGSGKEHARTVIKEILHRAAGEDGDKLWSEGVASHAGMITALVGSPAKVFLLDEFGRFLRTLTQPGTAPHLANIVSVLLKLYSSSGSTYKSDDYADAEKSKSINQPGANLYATTVPENLYESFSHESVTGGLIGRLFIFEGDEKPERGSPVEGEIIPDELVEHARGWIDFKPNEFYPENPDPVVVPMTTEARGILADFGAEVENRVIPVSQSPRDNFTAVWTRAEEKARKLALIHAASRGIEGIEIDGQSAQWATDVVRYLTERILWLVPRLVSENAFDAARRRILSLILDAGPDGRTQAEIVQSTQTIPKRVREDAISNLLEGGIVGKQLAKKSKAGRPATVFVGRKHLEVLA